MFFHTFWALVLGFTLSGAVQVFVSRKSMEKTLGDRSLKTITKASLFGVISSSCSYAASALARSIFMKGANFTAAMVFMFASTNLVIELGLVLWLMLGWQFALAEFVGGVVMISLLSLLLPIFIPESHVASARDTSHDGSEMEGHNHHASEEKKRSAFFNRENWRNAAGYTIGDFVMLRKELIIGFLVAGLATSLVPISFWQSLFITGHGFWSAVENAAIGPFLAFISFVCSVGNVPLAAALWHGGISFGGVVAFIFADLLAFPLVMIYRKQYGNKIALRMSLVFWFVMSLSGLITEENFLHSEFNSICSRIKYVDE